MLDRPATDAGFVTISVTVNGRALSVATPPFAPLAETLRERLGLTATKIGCDAGDCGACTVLLEGEQVCACLVPSGQVDGCAIVTADDAGSDPLIDRLRHAFLARGAAQCGICTPGMLMAATDLLRREPAASRDAIDDALGGVLCRCTGYQAIVEAVMDVAAGVLPVAPVAAAGCAVGTRIARADGWAKVAGTDKFGAD